MNASVPIPAIPIDHVIVMCYAWFSHICYAIVCYKIIIGRRTISQLRTAFFTIFLLNSIGDFTLFLIMELIMRPRKYRYFGLIHMLPNYQAEISFLLLIFAKTGVTLSFIPLAANRFTAFVLPYHYDKIWRTSNIIYVYILLWWTSLCFTLLLKVVGVSCEFILLQNGLLQITGRMQRVEQYFSITITTCVVLVCFCLFVLTISAARREKANSGTNNDSLERKLIIYGLFTSLPLLAENIRCWYGVQSTDLRVTIIVADIWFHLTECTTSLQCWSLILLGSNFIRLIFKKKSTSDSTSTQMFQSRTTE